LGRPLCTIEGCRCLAKKNGLNKDGTQRYKNICSAHSKRRHEGLYNGYEKEILCNCCGFVADHSIQLDVDHIDGDHNNDELDNLQTLCANCHRLKTWTNQDWL